MSKAYRYVLFTLFSLNYLWSKKVIIIYAPINQLINQSIKYRRNVSILAKCINYLRHEILIIYEQQNKTEYYYQSKIKKVNTL